VSIAPLPSCTSPPGALTDHARVHQVDEALPSRLSTLVLPRGLIRDWDYVPGAPRHWLALRRRVRAWWHAQPAPARAVIKPPAAGDMWIVYFVFAPEGRLEARHHFTLARCRDVAGARLMVVCAAPSVGQVPVELSRYADALYWKDLPGYDFSAYALALHEIASVCPGASVLVLNDSVLGPFHDLAPFLRSRRWQLSGFTASSLVENHIQSYAFVLHEITAALMKALASVFPVNHGYSRPGDVILCQEVWLAQLASRTISVGARWFSEAPFVADATLVCPFTLLDDGFPFLKRSLLGKHSTFQDPAEVRAVLDRLGHP
jgi:hypothetical protein